MNTNSPNSNSSPKFRNLKLRQKQSPLELKDKIRKDYREKVRGCRMLLVDNIRGCASKDEMRSTLKALYTSVFNFTDSPFQDHDEQSLVQEIEEECIQEELKWVIQEYEKSQLENVDWSIMERNDDVVCPVCQRDNLVYVSNKVSCVNCQWTVRTQKTLMDIKSDIMKCLESHNSACNSIVEFTMISDRDPHIFLLCGVCMEMQLVI